MAAGLAAFVSVLLGLAALAVAALVVVISTGGVRDQLTSRAGALTGRELSINGGLSLDLLTFTPSLVARDVVFGNVDWGSRPEMARIGRLAIEIDLRRLLTGNVHIRGLTLEDADLLLEQDAQGRANWNFEAAPDAKAVDAAIPEQRQQMPSIDRLTLRNARITYRSPRQSEPTVATFAALDARQEPERIALTAAGDYQERPFRLEGSLGDFAVLQDEDKPYPVQLKATIGGTSTSIEGTLDDPLNFTGFNAAITLSGKTLRELHDVLGLPMPASPVYELRGRLVSGVDLWRLEDFTGRLGASDLAGTLAIATAGDIPKLTAELRSRALDFADLAGFLGEEEVEGKQQAATARNDDRFLLPEDPIDLTKLRTVDAEIAFVAQRIKRGGLLLDSMDTRFTLKGGRLEMKPLAFGLAKGKIAGDLILDGSAEIPRLSARMRIRGVDLGTLVKPVDPDTATWGRIYGRFQLAGRGRSVHQIAASMNGEAVAYMAEGEIGNVLLEGIALDLPEVLASMMGEDKNSPINCMILPVDVRNGVIQAEHLMLDAAEDTIIGKGYLDFRDESLELRLIPYPRDFSLFNAPSTVTIRGSLARREVAVDKGEMVAEFAKKLLMAPLVPFMEMMKEDEVAPCAPVERALQRQGVTPKKSG